MNVLRYLSVCLLVILFLSKKLVNGQQSSTCLFQGCFCDFNLNDIICQGSQPPRLNFFPERNQQVNMSFVRIFVFMYYDFQTIPANVFKGLSINTLLFIDNNLQTINKDSFANVTALKQLEIYDKKLQSIEASAFKHIVNSMTHLTLSNALLNDTKLNSLIVELKVLTNLERLSFYGNQLSKIPANLIDSFAKLQELNLDSNQIQTIESNTFRNNKLLKVLSLNWNQMSNLTQLITELVANANQLEQLKLRSNLIQNLVSFSQLSQLKQLHLSTNQIKEIKETHFAQLVNLEALWLSENLIDTIHSNSFTSSLNSLKELKLDNNRLSSVPSFANLPNLITLDLSNQNGQLKSLPNYAFDRTSASKKLSVSLLNNQIGNYGDKLFCLRNSQENFLTEVKISHLSARNLNKCVLKQLNQKKNQADLPVISIESASNEINSTYAFDVYKNVCELRKYALEWSVTLKDNLNFALSNCTNVGLINECLNRTQFDCSPEPTTTTTSTTTKTSTTTTTSTTTATTSSTTTKMTTTTTRTTTTQSTTNSNSASKSINLSFTSLVLISAFVMKIFAF